MLGRNNPFNLEANDIEWEGELPRTGRFANFATMAAGARAGLRVLANKQKLHGCMTTRQIITAFATRADNNPLADYAKYVADHVGVDPDAPINLTDPDTLRRFGDAVTHFETGYALADLGSALKDVLLSALGLA